MYLFVADFSKKKEKKKKETSLLSDVAKVGTGGYLGVEGLRRGIPRLAGARVESHSTSRKAAKDIFDEGGYLDPNKMGRVTGSAQGEKMYDDKYSFITGRHSKANVPENQKYVDRLLANQLRKNYRGMAELTPEESSDLLVRNMQQQYRQLRFGRYGIDDTTKKKLIDQYNKAFGLNMKDFYDFESNEVADKIAKHDKWKTNKSFAELQKQVKKNSKKGKSLWVAGGDEFFDKNFTPDEDMPMLAMKTKNKLKVSKNRFAAVVDAAKREGLLNMMKKNPKRVLAGLGITAASAGALGLAAQGAKNISDKIKVKAHRRGNKIVKGFTRSRRKKK